MTSVLFVVSAADGWTLADGSVHPTGYWAEELAVPHRVFTEAGWQVRLATPGGVPPTVDRVSLGVAGGLPGKRKKVERYLDSIADQLARPEKLEDVADEDFDLVFYPGGHGPMEDLSHDATSGALLARRVAEGLPIALLCHSPAAVLAAGAKGANPFTGYEMTGLSNLEEKGTPAARKAKWLLQDALEEAGVRYTKATLPFRPFVVVDRNVYSGQNPQSSEELATRLVADLGH